MSCNGFHIFLGAVVVILRIRVQNSSPPPNHRCGDPVSSYTTARTLLLLPRPPQLYTLTLQTAQENRPQKATLTGTIHLPIIRDRENRVYIYHVTHRHWTHPHLPLQNHPCPTQSSLPNPSRTRGLLSLKSYLLSFFSPDAPLTFMLYLKPGHSLTALCPLKSFQVRMASPPTFRNSWG